MPSRLRFWAGVCAGVFLVGVLVARELYWWWVRAQIVDATSFGRFDEVKSQLRLVTWVTVCVVAVSLIVAMVSVRPLLSKASVSVIGGEKLMRLWLVAVAVLVGYAVIRFGLGGQPDDAGAVLVPASARPGMRDVAATLAGLDLWPYSSFDVVGLILAVLWLWVHLVLLRDFARRGLEQSR